VTEPPPHLRYRNAKPHNDFIDHWPTVEEREALQEAKRMADAKFNQGHHGAMTTSHVLVRGGQGARATVWRDAPQSYAAWIHAPNSTTKTGWMPMKAWWGVPEAYNDFGLREGPMDNRRRFGGGTININGPAPQYHTVYEDHYIRRQRRFLYEDGGEEHHGEITPQDTTLDFGTSQVNFQEGQAIEHHHAAKKQGFWGWLAKGTQKQQALPPPQREVNRGSLQAITVGHQPALPTPSRPGLPAPRRPEAKTLEEAIDHGRLDAHAGAHPQHNPYPPSDGRHQAWARGWQMAAGRALPSHQEIPMLVSNRQKVR
jgi:hypothetical protein